MRKSTCESVAGAEGWWQVALGQLRAWHVQISPDRAVVRAHALSPKIRSSEVLHKGFALQRHAMVDTRLLKPLAINQGLLLSICLLSTAESALHTTPLYIVLMHTNFLRNSARQGMHGPANQGGYVMGTSHVL